MSLDPQSWTKLLITATALFSTMGTIARWRYLIAYCGPLVTPAAIDWSEPTLLPLAASCDHTYTIENSRARCLKCSRPESFMHK
jgi:hypothetical protein